MSIIDLDRFSDDVSIDAVRCMCPRRGGCKNCGTSMLGMPRNRVFCSRECRVSYSWDGRPEVDETCGFGLLAATWEDER